jgi:hypothetical protein
LGLFASQFIFKNFCAGKGKELILGDCEAKKSKERKGYFKNNNKI